MICSTSILSFLVADLIVFLLEGVMCVNCFLKDILQIDDSKVRFNSPLIATTLIPICDKYENIILKKKGKEIFS